MTDRLTYTISEASQAMGIGRSMIYKLINDGDLRTVRVGRRVLIPRDSIFGVLGMEATASPRVETPRPGDVEERTYIVTIRPAPSSGRISLYR